MAGDGADKSRAAAKVQEAATSIHTTKGKGTEAVARRYFEAIAAREVEAAGALGAEGGREYVRGQVDVLAPEGVREFIGSLIEAMPDMRMEVAETTTEGERCAVRWTLHGTFAGPGSLNGVKPTGSPLTLEGVDVLTVREGKVQSNDAFADGMTVARQIGLLPEQGSGAEQGMTGAFNVKTKVTGMSAAAGAKLGGIKRVVLGHAHTDHRGVVPALGAPVFCHPEERVDAEGSGGFRYWPAGLAGLPTGQRQVHRALHRYAWDAGPVHIAGTLSEGDEIAGFKVIDLPGHAPGLIGLWRESERLALVSDCFYTVDLWARSRPPHVPDRIYNYDTEQAKASIRKLAEMEPAAAWPGHAKPVVSSGEVGGDVRSRLLKAAE